MFTSNLHYRMRQSRPSVVLPQTGIAASLPFNKDKLVTGGVALNQFDSEHRSGKIEMEESYLYSISMCGC